jgi:hypothetical protein
MAIPFTQYLLPDGRKKSISIDRPDAIEAIAEQFIAAGGWYEAEILTTGHVSLTAGLTVDDEPQDIAFQIIEIGPGMADAVDKLVHASIAYLSKVTA